MDSRFKAESIQLVTWIGSSPIYAPIQDGTTSGEWDTSQGYVSAIGGQDRHVLQFTGDREPLAPGSR